MLFELNEKFFQNKTNDFEHKTDNVVMNIYKLEKKWKKLIFFKYFVEKN
jgi:hypothetical protein